MAKKRRRAVARAETAPEMPKSVTIRKADNGYIVESYGEGVPRTKVADDKAAALKLAATMLGK